MLATAQDTDLDRGAISVGPGEVRTCALTREQRPVAEMIRFVVGPAGEVVPDVKRKLPGRGLWISASRQAIEDAVKRNVFARGFKRDVKTSRDLATETERLLERAALDALAVAGKAGHVATGFSKVEATLDQPPAKSGVLALMHAADGSEDGKRKLNNALQRNKGDESAEITVIGVFTGADLDLALNRPNVVHAAVLAGPASETFLARVARLTRFRTGNSPDSVSAVAPADGARELNSPVIGAQGSNSE